MIALPEDDTPAATALEQLISRRLMRAIIDFPEKFETGLKYLDPSHFASVEQQFLAGELRLLYDTHGTIPTHEHFSEHVKRILTVDNDPYDYEAVLALIAQSVSPRDAGAIAAGYTDWARKQAYGTLYSTEGMDAYHRGDYDKLGEILAAAKAIGTGSDPKHGLYRARDFDKIDDTKRWIIPSILAAEQTMLVSAPPKALKTSLMFDLGLSIATETKFLKTYQATKGTVLFYCTEDTQSVNRDRLDAMLKHRNGLTRNDLDDLWMAQRLPSKEELKQQIRQTKATVVIIDPLYKTLPEKINTASIGDMGTHLTNYEQICRDEGATLILTHHFNRKSEKYGRPELEDMSGAGPAEFAGQWILIRRPSAYDGSGIHRLNLAIGGRDGQNEHFQLVVQDNSNEAGKVERRWDIHQLQPQSELAQAERRENQRKATNDQDLLLTVMNELGISKEHICRKDIATAMGRNHAAVKRYVEEALQDGTLTPYTQKINNREIECFRLVERT